MKFNIKNMFKIATNIQNGIKSVNDDWKEFNEAISNTKELRNEDGEIDIVRARMVIKQAFQQYMKARAKNSKKKIPKAKFWINGVLRNVSKK